MFKRRDLFSFFLMPFKPQTFNEHVWVAHLYHCIRTGEEKLVEVLGVYSTAEKAVADFINQQPDVIPLWIQQPENRQHMKILWWQLDENNKVADSYRYTRSRMWGCEIIVINKIKVK